MNVRPLRAEDTERVLASGLGLARLPRDDGSFYLVAWDGDEPLGHAHLALTDPPELQDVSVLPPHRRRGVATALTRAAEREAAARGHPMLTLTGIYRRLTNPTTSTTAIITGTMGIAATMDFTATTAIPDTTKATLATIVATSILGTASGTTIIVIIGIIKARCP